MPPKLIYKDDNISFSYETTTPSSNSQAMYGNVVLLWYKERVQIIRWALHMPCKEHGGLVTRGRVPLHNRYLIAKQIRSDRWFLSDDFESVGGHSPKMGDALDFGMNLGRKLSMTRYAGCEFCGDEERDITAEEYRAMREMKQQKIDFWKGR